MRDPRSRPVEPLDDDTAERLLAGRLDPEDAPPAYAEVTRLLGAAAGPARPDELAGWPAAVAMFRAARRRRRLRARVAALAVAGMLLAGAAAAGPGALPAPVERVARAVGRAGALAPAEPVRVLPPPRRTTPATTTGRPPAGVPGRDGGVELRDPGPAGTARPGKPAKPPKPRPVRPKPPKPKPAPKAKR